MSLIELTNADKFMDLTNKYKFGSIDNMLNTMLPIIEWALIHEVNIREDIVKENEKCL